MATRYKVHSEWTISTETTVLDIGTDRKGIVITEIADAIDTQTGHVYVSGAYRVRAKTKIKGLPRGKTFIGETAWSQAESLHRDMVTAMNLADLPD
jgi:hypothetical protein